MAIKKDTLVIIVLLILTACSDRTKESADNFHKINESRQNIFIKDTSQYSKNFINNILYWNDDRIQFIDSLLIIGNDTALISTELPLNKKKIFFGCEGEELCNGCGNDSICYLLMLERINYSTIKYRIEKSVKNIKSYVETGNADLDHNFCYLSKDDEYERELNFYSKLDLLTNKTSYSDTCNLTISIGTNGDGIFFAKLSRPFCKNEVNDIYNCPTLNEKK